MKKIIFCIIVSIAIHGRSMAQNAYYDAINISRNLDGAGQFGPSHFPVLKKYFPGKTDLQIAAALAANPFLSSYFNSASLASLGSFFESGSVFSSIGNLNVTNFADGIAKFLIQRSKEELNVAFFRKFQDFIRSYPEIQVVFPTTVDIVKNIAAYDYAGMLPAMKSAFQKDLVTFSDNLLNLRESSKYVGYSTDPVIQRRADSIITFFNTLPGRSISACIITSDGIVKGSNAAEIINNVAADNVTDDIFSATLRFTDLISQSLRSTDEGRVWVTRQQVNTFINNTDALKIYLGLVYGMDQRDIFNGHPIRFVFTPIAGSVTVTLSSFLTDLSTAWKTVPAQNFIREFGKLAGNAANVADITKNIIEAEKQGNEPSILQYADYASSIATFMKNATTLMSKGSGINAALSNISPVVTKFTSVIETAVNCSYDIKSQSYGSLVLHTSLLLDEILQGNFSFKNQYIKYATFMANIAEAKNSSEIQAAIETAVLPVGSSSIKRETAMNIAMNAYIGAYAGVEYMPSLPADKTAFSAGLTAPVGIAFSWGGIRYPANANEGGKSVTLFVPLIDIGTLASYRIGDSKTNISSEIQLKNIISPGLYVYWGFGKCPISLGAGAQLGPQLRNVAAGVATTDTKNIYIRYGVNLAVDIPLLNFYTKSKN